MGVVSFGSVTERGRRWGWLDGEGGDGGERGGKGWGWLALEALQRGEGGGCG